MEKAPAEMMREFVRSQNFTSTDEVMTAMKDMFKDILQEIMECELADELGYEKSERVSNDECSNKSKNYRNGYSKKTVKTQLGELDIKVPRDRNGEYEPKIISKYNRNADGMEEKILSLYACGMSQRDISEQIKNLYDVEISPEFVSKISEKIMPDVTAWQILGIWIGENESSKFWLNVLNELKTRGIKDVFLFCVDGLTGFRQAIEAAFPNAQIQRCIIHQIRSSTRFVSYKHIKELMANLKKVYQAISEEEAMNNLILFKDKWGKTYPSCVKSWEENWDILSTFFAYPPEVRKIIYTTNIIEGLNRQFRQITKNKPSFTNDDSLRKMLYLASQKIVERWTQRCRNWDIVLSQLSIIFEDRIPA